MRAVTEPVRCLLVPRKLPAITQQLPLDYLVVLIRALAQVILVRLTDRLIIKESRQLGSTVQYEVNASTDLSASSSISSGALFMISVPTLST